MTLALLLTACARGTPTPTKAAGPETVISLAYNPADGSLLKTDAAGLFRLPADGTTWDAIQTPATSGLSGVVLNPADPATLYVSGPNVGVLKSTDGGASWVKVNTGLANTNITALAIHSFRRETLYAWVSGDGIYRTEDGGASWKRMPDQGPPDTSVRGLVHSTLPGSMNTGWLYASTPSGAYLSMDCF
jgi:photosystem II stability/assembly factor-like uncharacterized protein